MANGWLGMGRPFFLFVAIYGRDGDGWWYRMRVNGGRVNDGSFDS